MDEVMGTGNDVKQEKGREAPSGGRVTIRELAEAAGVSTATVSNVIHGKTKRVSPETIRRVQELIQTMGYVRGGSGEEKRAGGSGLVALLANPHKTYEEAIGADPFYGKIIGMTEQYLREKGYCIYFTHPLIWMTFSAWSQNERWRES